MWLPTIAANDRPAGARWRSRRVTPGAATAPPPRRAFRLANGTRGRMASASRPHCDICQSSSTCAAAQAASASSAPAASASASSAEPVSVVIEATAASRQASAGISRARARRSPRAAAPPASRPAPARSARRARRAPSRAPDPRRSACRSTRPCRRLGAIEHEIAAEIFFDLRGDRLAACRPPRRSPHWRAASAACAPDRSHLACAFHSAAIASASAARGAASGRRAGVCTGLPSSSTAKPPSPSSPDMRPAGRSACAVAARTPRRADSIGSSGWFSKISVKMSRISFA